MDDLGPANQTIKFQEAWPPDHAKRKARIVERASGRLRYDGDVVRHGSLAVRWRGPFGEAASESRRNGLDPADRWRENIRVDKYLHTFSGRSKRHSFMR